MFQFSEILKRVKRVVIDWAKQKYINSQQQLREVEMQIAHIYEQSNSRVFSQVFGTRELKSGETHIRDV